MDDLFFSFSDDELRSRCRTALDTFEMWSRRVIDEAFREKYGHKYLDHMIDDNTPLVKTSIRNQIQSRMEQSPKRFPRPIDAVLMEDIAYFYCRDDLYKKHFELIFAPFFSGSSEIKSVLNRLIGIRNKLAHSNVISHHEALQALCYTSDFVSVYKAYYESLGKAEDYNVPTFISLMDSLGNSVQRTDSGWPWEIWFTSWPSPAVYLRSGDKYRITVEVDSTFDASSYRIEWEISTFYHVGNLKGEGNIIDFAPTNQMVSARPEIIIKLISDKDWHKIGYHKCDDMVKVKLENILPPIEESF